MKKYLLTIMTIFIFNVGQMGVSDKDQAQVYGQSQDAPMPPKQEKGRDPFRLPPGIKPLAPKGEEEKKVKREESEDLKKTTMVESVSDQQPQPSFSPIVLRAILISDRIRLAAIEEKIVTEGTIINGEKVLEIKPDRVILDQGGKRRTLYLPQSSIPLSVEER